MKYDRIAAPTRTPEEQEQALVRFDDDWVTATQKLKAHKSYGNGEMEEKE